MSFPAALTGAIILLGLSMVASFVLWACGRVGSWSEQGE